MYIGACRIRLRCAENDLCYLLCSSFGESSPKQEHRSNAYAQNKRFYTNRATGGHLDHSITIGDLDAGFAVSEETGSYSCMPVKPETVGSFLLGFHAR